MPHQIQVIGSLGRDAELRYLPSGTQVLEFSVASNDGYGEHKQTAWFRCALFGNRAEGLVNHLSKGKAVVAWGTLRADEKGNPRIWQGNDGEFHTNFEVRVDRLEFAPTNKSQMVAAAVEAGGQVSDMLPPEDDIPF